MIINLTKLLEVVHLPEKPIVPTTDASYLPISEDRTSPYGAYAFELEDAVDF